MDQSLYNLVDRARVGERASLDALFTETYNDVYYFALKTVKNEDVAGDITQDSFVTIFKTIQTLQEPAAYVAWSRQITYRHCLKHLGKSREVTVEDNEDGTNIFDTVAEENPEFIPDEALDQEDFRNTVMGMIHQLPYEQRSAVLMYYFDELSVKEIAQIQDVSEGTVKSRLNYGRKAIKGSVEEYEKKSGVRLHSFAIVPLLLWLLLRDKSACSVSAGAVKTALASTSVAAGGMAAEGAVAGGAVAAKGAASGLLVKVAAGITGAAVLVGGGIWAGSTLKADPTPPATIATVYTEPTQTLPPATEPATEPTTEVTEPETTAPDGYVLTPGVFVGYGEDPHTFYHIFEARTITLTVKSFDGETITGHLHVAYITDERSEIYESDFVGSVTETTDHALYFSAELLTPRELSVLGETLLIENTDLIYHFGDSSINVEIYRYTKTEKIN